MIIPLTSQPLIYVLKHIKQYTNTKDGKNQISHCLNLFFYIYILVRKIALSYLNQVICMSAHVLFTLFVFVYV